LVFVFLGFPLWLEFGAVQSLLILIPNFGLFRGFSLLSFPVDAR
jgi:hypothetical protein